MELARCLKWCAKEGGTKIRRLDLANFNTFGTVFTLSDEVDARMVRFSHSHETVVGVII